MTVVSSNKNLNTSTSPTPSMYYLGMADTLEGSYRAISGHVGLNVEMLMFLSRCHCVKSSAHQGMLHVILYEI